MFKNKHVIIALLVAPILALISYFAVDYLVSEKPHVAQDNAAYKLVASSNCRYDSGMCTLKNGDVVIDLTSETDSRGITTMYLTSVFPVDSAVLGLFGAGAKEVPRKMQRRDDSGQSWVLELEQEVLPGAALRLALQDDTTAYFAQIPVTFMGVVADAR